MATPVAHSSEPPRFRGPVARLRVRHGFLDPGVLLSGADADADAYECNRGRGSLACASVMGRHVLKQPRRGVMFAVGRWSVSAMGGFTTAAVLAAALCLVTVPGTDAHIDQDD